MDCRQYPRLQVFDPVTVRALESTSQFALVLRRNVVEERKRQIELDAIQFPDTAERGRPVNKPYFKVVMEFKFRKNQLDALPDLGCTAVQRDEKRPRLASTLRRSHP